MGNQMALVVHVQHGFNAQHGAEQRGGAGDAPAALEVVEVVHRKPVRQTVAVSSTHLATSSMEAPCF